MDTLARVSQIAWYHTIELTPGLTTEGVFDLRPQVHRYGLPERLDRMRVLDVGSLNGFWAFEMERRGASEVVALDVDDERDLDWPVRRRGETFPDHHPEQGLRLATGGEGFRLAKEILGSTVERVSCRIYDARPEDLGTFDLVFCGSVLMHVRDQLLALERIFDLCRGAFISAEEYDRAAALVPFPVSRFRANRPGAVVFWAPAPRTWRRMIWTAGFDRVEEHGRFRLRARRGWAVPHVVHHAYRNA